MIFEIRRRIIDVIKVSLLYRSRFERIFHTQRHRVHNEMYRTYKFY